MTNHDTNDETARQPTRAPDAGRRPARLALVPPGSPRRAMVTALGVSPLGGGELIGLAPADARHHLHVPGPTGAGKSTLLVNYVIGQARAGRGVAVFDPGRGDLIRDLLDRLPESVARRLVLIDPDEKQAPPAWNLFDLADEPEQVAEQLVGVMSKVWAQYWGPRTDDLARHAVLTLAHLPDGTLSDLPVLLADTGWRRRVMTVVRRRADAATRAGLERFWAGWDELTPAGQHTQAGPLLSKLRAVLSRRFAVELFGTAASTFRLADILNGGVLLVRLPKGVLGEDTVRLVGSLLLAGLLHTAQARAALPEPDRLDASIVVDEAHNLLHLPIGVGDALAEARGLHVSLVLAHQHLGQLTGPIADDIDANARNKVFFALAPSDARKLVHHVAPYFAPEDLIHRDPYGIVCRLVIDGHDGEPFSLDTRPAPPAWPGRADTLRAAARQRGLTRAERRALAETRMLGPAATRTAAGGATSESGTAGQASGDHTNPAVPAAAPVPTVPSAPVAHPPPRVRHRPPAHPSKKKEV